MRVKLLFLLKVCSPLHLQFNVAFFALCFVSSLLSFSSSRAENVWELLVGLRR